MPGLLASINSRLMPRCFLADGSLRVATSRWLASPAPVMKILAPSMANWSPSHYTECLVQLSPHATALDARSIDDTVASVDKAIAEGGRAVAVVEIGVLLRKGGVLDRLKAEGISIAGP